MKHEKLLGVIPMKQKQRGRRIGQGELQTIMHIQEAESGGESPRLKCISDVALADLTGSCRAKRVC